MALSDPLDALTTARHLVDVAMPEHDSPDAAAAGAEHALAQLFRNLSQWIGAVGCNALFARALMLSTPHHPVLRGVRFQMHDGTPQLERLAENAREFGSQVTAEGVTAVLASIITMLSGLIGEDITMSILEEVPSRTPETSPATISGSSTGSTPKPQMRASEGGHHHD